MSLSAADLELLQIRNKFLENQVQEISTALSELHKQSEITLEESENRLKTSESLLSAMFMRSAVGMAITDINGKFIKTNPCYQEMVGYSENELELMRFIDVTLPEDVEENLRLRDSVLYGECESYQMEKRFVHHDGRIVWVRATSSKISDDTGKAPLFIGVLENIGDRKSAEIERQEAIEALYQLNQQLESRVEQRTHELKFANEQLIVTNTELAHATKLKDEFLANMSHELRTPLNAILGISEGLLDKVYGDVNDRQKRSLSLIETSGRHLLELINDVLDIAKIGAGKLKLEINPVAIGYLCNSSLNFVKQMATKKNIQITISIQPNLGAIAVDERRMRQALINLLSNAVKFTPMGGKICLEVKLIKTDTINLPEIADFTYAFIFSIIDTGIGIAQEDISKLFQVFVQIDSSLNRQYTGTGLGLALVKQITELHGGCVSITSQVGEGSCFSIILPYTGEIKLSDRVPLATIIP